MNTAQVYLPTKEEIIARRERLWGKPPVKNAIARGPIKSPVITPSAKERIAIHRAEKAEIKRAADIVSMVSAFSSSGNADFSLIGEYRGEAIAGIFVCFKQSMESIAYSVLTRHPNVSLSDIKSHNRRHPVVKARHEIVYMIREIRPDISYPMIGRFLNKDHTSVINSFRMHSKAKAALEAS